MHIAHILRKYDPAEWGGTETAVLRLVEGLQAHGATSTVYAPQLRVVPAADPLADAGAVVRRYRSFVPVLGISPQQREQLVRWGGNVMSFDLLWQLRRDTPHIVHTHALNRLAGVAMLAARSRGVPFVVSIHGGACDLPVDVQAKLTEPLRGGFEWGKALGMLVKSIDLRDVYVKSFINS
ncbi:MAG: glycosyltransferase [Roseimicrobium sp.]